MKKKMSETRNIAVPFSESGKVFYFTCNRKEIIDFLFIRKVFGAENGIYSKGVKSVDTRTKFPYN